MKYLVTLFCVFIHSVSFSQTADSEINQSAPPSKRVSFTAKVDKAHASKDGIHMNGYIVNIGYKEIQRLHGKTIKVTGKVTIVRGLNNEPKEYDKNGREVPRQGRAEDTKHILEPKIRIIEE